MCQWTLKRIFDDEIWVPPTHMFCLVLVQGRDYVAGWCAVGAFLAEGYVCTDTRTVPTI